jgi:hypothetical protein
LARNAFFSFGDTHLTVLAIEHPSSLPPVTHAIVSFSVTHAVEHNMSGKINT